MAIDYQHPIILKMKRLYNKAGDTYEEIERERRRREPGADRGFIQKPDKEFIAFYAKGVETLKAIPPQIALSIEKMKQATDLPEKDRDYYLAWMPTYLKNIEDRLKAAESTLNSLTQKKATRKRKP